MDPKEVGRPKILEKYGFFGKKLEGTGAGIGAPQLTYGPTSRPRGAGIPTLHCFSTSIVLFHLQTLQNRVGVQPLQSLVLWRSNLEPCFGTLPGRHHQPCCHDEVWVVSFEWLWICSNSYMALSLPWYSFPIWLRSICCNPVFCLLGYDDFSLYAKIYSRTYWYSLCFFTELFTFIYALQIIGLWITYMVCSMLGNCIIGGPSDRIGVFIAS